MAQFNLADILSGLNPNINSDLLKAARYFTKGEQDIIRRLTKPSKAEKNAEKRLKEVKSEEELSNQISELFGGTRAASQEAIQQGRAMGSALSSAIANAASGVGGAVGGDDRVAQMIANASMDAAGRGREAGVALSSLGEAASGSVGIQQAAAIANALSRRSSRIEDIQDRLDEASAAREAALMQARAGRQGGFLQMITSLLGLKPSGGYGGGGGTTTVSPTGGQIDFSVFGGVDRLLPSGYRFYSNPTASASQTTMFAPGGTTTPGYQYVPPTTGASKNRGSRNPNR